jgi:NitT/TauT family transport system substrate-binding protein
MSVSAVRQRRGRSAVFGLIAAAAVVAAASACASSASQVAAGSSPSKPLITIKVSYLPVSDSASFFIALNDGFFKNEGLNVEPTLLYTGANTIPALVSGSIDLASGGPNAAFFKAVAESPNTLKVVAGQAIAQEWNGATGTAGIYVRDGVPVSTPSQLEGQTVYIPALGHQSQYYTYLWMKAAGLTMADYKKVKWGILQGAFPAVDAAFRTKRINVGIGGAPQSLDWSKENIAKPLFLFGQPDPNAQLLFWVANNAFATQHPQALIGFIKAMSEASAVYKKAFEQGPSSAAYKGLQELVGKQLKVAPSSVILDPGLSTALNGADLDGMAKFFVQVGYNSSAPNAQQYIDTKYLDSATGQ